MSAAYSSPRGRKTCGKRTLDTRSEQSVAFALFGSLASSNASLDSPRSKRLQAKSQSVARGEALPGTHPKFPVEAIRALFPALHRKPAFTFFDNAAGAQVPQRVIDRSEERRVGKECRSRRSAYQ